MFGSCLEKIFFSASSFSRLERPVVRQRLEPDLPLPLEPQPRTSSSSSGSTQLGGQLQQGLGRGATPPGGVAVGVRRGGPARPALNPELGTVGEPPPEARRRCGAAMAVAAGWLLRGG